VVLPGKIGYRENGDGREEWTVDSWEAVPKIDDATFQRLASEARDGCPVSRALRGNVDIQVAATLSS
jgi:organic hydroperoxide reductase OsmC/OhrA